MRLYRSFKATVLKQYSSNFKFNAKTLLSVLKLILKTETLEGDLKERVYIFMYHFHERPLLFQHRFSETALFPFSMYIDSSLKTTSTITNHSSSNTTFLKHSSHFYVNRFLLKDHPPLLLIYMWPPTREGTVTVFISILFKEMKTWRFTPTSQSSSLISTLLFNLGIKKRRLRLTSPSKLMATALVFRELKTWKLNMSI